MTGILRGIHGFVRQLSAHDVSHRAASVHLPWDDWRKLYEAIEKEFPDVRRFRKENDLKPNEFMYNGLKFVGVVDPPPKPSEDDYPGKYPDDFPEHRAALKEATRRVAQVWGETAEAFVHAVVLTMRTPGLFDFHAGVMPEERNGPALDAKSEPIGDWLSEIEQARSTISHGNPAYDVLGRLMIGLEAGRDAWSPTDPGVMARAKSAADAPYDLRTCARYPWAAVARINYLEGRLAAIQQLIDALSANGFAREQLKPAGEQQDDQNQDDDADGAGRVRAPRP